MEMRASADITQTWLICRTGAISLAIPIHHVVEIARVLPLEALAGAPDIVRGVAIMRGKPVPAIDSGHLIRREACHATRMVALRSATRSYVLLVEQVLGVVEMMSERALELPPLLGSVGEETIQSIGILDRSLLVLLDAARVVPEHVYSTMDAAETLP